MGREGGGKKRKKKKERFFGEFSNESSNLRVLCFRDLPLVNIITPALSHSLSLSLSFSLFQLHPSTPASTSTWPIPSSLIWFRGCFHPPSPPPLLCSGLRSRIVSCLFIQITLRFPILAPLQPLSFSPRCHSSPRPCQNPTVFTLIVAVLLNPPCIVCARARRGRCSKKIGAQFEIREYIRLSAGLPRAARWNRVSRVRKYGQKVRCAATLLFHNRVCACYIFSPISWYARACVSLFSFPCKS